MTPLSIASFVLALLALAASGMAAVKPYSKEKFFFAFVALLFAYTVFFSSDKSKDTVKEDVSKNRNTLITSQNQPVAFQTFLDGASKGVGESAPANDDSASSNVPDPAAILGTEYLQKPGTKSLFRRQVELKPLGRVQLPAPNTPGIQVLAGLTMLGPDLRSMPNRQPLGILDPKAGTDLPK